MSTYDLNKLNDKEFEALAAQVVISRTGRSVERFKPGKDKGVDGRFFVAGAQEAIIQAKHWERSGITLLLAALEKKEAPKVRALKPSRYLLVTSVPLSRANKQAIKALFAPHLLSEEDVIGHEDVQDFLRENPKIVEQHYKLWLASAEVLRLIYTAPIIGRSAFKMEDVLAFSRKYVATKCHAEALNRLNASGAIIIIGEPGIGKSTLAEQLVLNYAVKGYELCFVENELTEAEAVWRPNRRQIFYYDDFLGRNYLDVIGRNHDSHVINFIRRVGNDKSKRFILTSRTTIMQQGKSLSDLFRTHNIDQREYEVRITDITPVDKAKILYNHLWFGDLDEAFVEQLYVDKRYHQVIAHQNFNPRLISFITDTHKIAGIQAEQYWNYVLRTLENLRDVWHGVFEHQLDDLGRLIASLVVFHGGTISEKKLRAACERTRLSTVPSPTASEWQLRFERSFQMSVGAIITRSIDRALLDAKVGLFNPSVGDFIIHRFCADENTIESFASLLRDDDALTQLFSLRRGKLITEDCFRQVLRRLVSRFWQVPFESPDFATGLSLKVSSDDSIRDAFRVQLAGLASGFFDLADATSLPENLSPYAVYAVNEKLIAPDDERWLKFARSVIGRTGLDEDLTGCRSLSCYSTIYSR